VSHTATMLHVGHDFQYESSVTQPSRHLFSKDVFCDGIDLDLRMTIKPLRTRLFRPTESLADFIIEHLPQPPEGSVLVVTSKIMALSQGRIVTIKDATSKDRAIRKESSRLLRTPWCWLSYKNGEWCANAGVDESNADNRLLLLPTRIQETTRHLLTQLKTHYHRKHLGLIVTDTRIYPMRVGTMGVAVGFAGFEGIRSYIGQPDLFGRTLKRTTANVVHALSVAAVLTMGEGNERTPLAIITDAPVSFTTKPQSLTALAIKPEDDLYRAAYRSNAHSSRVRAIRRPSQ